MLDDIKVINLRDKSGALLSIASIYKQASFDIKLSNNEHDSREIHNIIIAGMGGSGIAGDLLKILVKDEIVLPIEVIKDYSLPNYCDSGTLVIIVSFSGNTEESLSCLKKAREKSCEISIITQGGELERQANTDNIMLGKIKDGLFSRHTSIYVLKIMLKVLIEFNILSVRIYDSMSSSYDWLKAESELWESSVPTEHNYAKQLALQAVGKTPVFYTGPKLAPLAEKWKINWNENAKNTAFWNYFPEFSHNEFTGWTGQPIEKPFAIFDLVSESEDSQILKRFAITDKLLSGKRPKAVVVPVQGETILHQILWGIVLGEFASTYVAVLNNVDPTPVPIVDKLKAELN